MRYIRVVLVRLLVGGMEENWRLYLAVVIREDSWGDVYIMQTQGAVTNWSTTAAVSCQASRTQG